MKILHTCLAAFYIDNFSYQENILPKIHKQLGIDVSILASTETYSKDIKRTYLEPSTYVNNDEVEVTRLAYINWIPFFLAKKLRIYKGVKKYLKKTKPDIIFLHDCQFLSINAFVKYAKRNKVKIYVDCHTDFINSGRSWISEHILHRIIYKYCAKQIENYVSKFYGTLPLRNDFLEKVYGINKNKIELLPFGADDTLFNWDDINKIRKAKREELNFTDSDFVIITGGKIDKRKNIHILLETFNELCNSEKFINIKLIVFGKPTEELQLIIHNLIQNKQIIYIDWLASTEIHKYILASDLGFFPGTHSVLWEESIGLGLPCVFYKWEGMDHLDVGGNCVFINSTEEIKETLEKVIFDQNKFNQLNSHAKDLGPKKFAYSQIAKKAIEI